VSPSKRRRANGEGSVYQRPNGSWVGAAYAPIVGGRRKRKEVYGKTKTEVLTKLRRLQADVAGGLVLPERDWRLGEYLVHWLQDVVKPERRPKTYQGYELAVRLHIEPVLGKRRLSHLRVGDVRALVEGLQAKGLGARMVQFVHAVLRNALQNAVREELVTRNVASLVRVRTPVYDVGRGLSTDQARRLITSTATSRHHAAIVLALYLGLRRGELLGLRWDDVDLDAGRLEVRHSLQRVEGELLLLAPKTRSSRRTCPLPEPCVTALRVHRVAQHRERMALGESWTETGMVFTSEAGTSLDPDNFSRAWGRLRAVLGDPPVRFHDLRHTCVTLLLDSGVPPHVVRDIVGHSALDVTMNIYAHVSLDEKRKAMTKLADRLA